MNCLYKKMKKNIKQKSNEIRKEIEEIYSSLSQDIKQKVRSEATKRAKSNAIKYGKKVDEYSPGEWRQILKQEEGELKKEIWKKGGVGILSFTLFPWLWF